LAPDDDLHSILQLRARYEPSVIRDVIWGRQADASAQHLGRDRVGFTAAGWEGSCTQSIHTMIDSIAFVVYSLIVYNNGGLMPCQE
jgi:hypothetical protein